jgi:transposase
MSVMIGIDPHKGSHAAVVVNPDEVVIDETRVRATADQLGELQEWASGYTDRCWAVESACGMGYLLAQQLVGAGERVVDVPAMMASRVRLLGSGKSQKNDPNDARSVAIAALRHPGLAMVHRDDHTRVLGLLAKRHRDIARLKNKAACRLHALLAELTPGGLATEMTVNKANALLESVEVTDEVTRQRVVIASELVDDIGRCDAQMRSSKRRIRDAVAASGTSLRDIRGVGPIGAAIILGSVGDVARFPTAGHFASYNATAPIDASLVSGSGIGSTREGIANSTTPSTSLRSPSSATPEQAATTTTRRSPKAKPAKKQSERSSDGYQTSSTGTSSPTPNAPSTEQKVGQGGHPGTTL